jgi:hypothetical protein
MPFSCFDEEGFANIRMHHILSGFDEEGFKPASLDELAAEPEFNEEIVRLARWAKQGIDKKVGITFRCLYVMDLDALAECPVGGLCFCKCCQSRVSV